jgi:hypothetical protein
MLFYKLSKYGVPRKLISLLKAVYKNPLGVLNFQGHKSEPLEMGIGLRQGCVLSPVLFSLFIADLGREMEESELGVTLHLSRIVGCHFADDMALVAETEAQMELILKLTGDYAATWKIEFSGPKSFIITFGRQPGNKKWILVTTPIREVSGRAEPVIIGELKMGKYLGLLLQGGGPLYRLHVQAMISKARSSTNLLKQICEDLLNPNTHVTVLWKAYCRSKFMYGCEIACIPKCDMKRLNVEQRKALRCVLHLPYHTNNLILLAETGIESITEFVVQQKLGYLKYLMQHTRGRWVYDALVVQEQWLVEDGGVLNDEGYMTVPENGFTAGQYFLKDLAAMLRDLGTEYKINLPLPMIDSQVTATSAKIVAGRLAYLDREIRLVNRGAGYEAEMTNKDYYNTETQNIWFRARMGALVSGTEAKKYCILCGLQKPLNLHMLLQCPVLNKGLYGRDDIRFVYITKLVKSLGLNGLLSFKLNFYIREIVNDWLKERLSEYYNTKPLKLMELSSVMKCYVDLPCQYSTEKIELLRRIRHLPY